MALYYTLPVYKSTYDLVKSIYIAVQHFPKQYKYSLGTDLQQETRRLVVLIFQANTHKEDRVRYLEEFESYMEMLKLNIRLSHELKCVNMKTHARLSMMLENIGKQITGWKKHSA